MLVAMTLTVLLLAIPTWPTTFHWVFCIQQHQPISQDAIGPPTLIDASSAMSFEGA
jgi:hypothetical protein